jgi:hypothetical protein
LTDGAAAITRAPTAAIDRSFSIFLVLPILHCLYSARPETALLLWAKIIAQSTDCARRAELSCARATRSQKNLRANGKPRRLPFRKTVTPARNVAPRFG